MAAIRDPYSDYRRNQIETADKATLLLMLYSGAIKFCRAARQAMEGEKIEETNQQLNKAQDVLCELMGSLNPDVPDISGSLFQLYEYMHYQLVQANLRRDPAMVAEVEKLLGTLLEAWQAAVKQEHGGEESVAGQEAPGPEDGPRRRVESRG